MKKWYVGLEGHEIVEKLTKRAEVIETMYRNDMSLADTFYDEYEKDHKEVRSKILDLRSEYYMYNKEIYQLWTDTLIAMDVTKARLDKRIDELFKSGVVSY